MTLSILLDVVISLAFLYMLLAIIASGFTEWIAQYLGLRGQFLRRGLIRLINDDDIYRRVIHHPLIGNLYRDRAARGKPPSYLDPKGFSSALADVMVARAAALSGAEDRHPAGALTIEGLREAADVLRINGHPLGSAILPVIDRASKDLPSALAEIERWFSAGMDRVSGWYRVRAGKTLFATALAIAVLGNVDTIQLVPALWKSPELRKSLVEAAEGAVRDDKVAGAKLSALLKEPPTPEITAKLLETLQAYERKGLPFGFTCLGDTQRAESVRDTIGVCVDAARTAMGESSFLLKLLGWLITAAAVSLGAPYWFDLLSKVVSIRGSGRKPPPA